MEMNRALEAASYAAIHEFLNFYGTFIEVLPEEEGGLPFIGHPRPLIYEYPAAF
jgi:hypothetical protein